MCACTYTYMTSLVKASYWQEPFLNYWGVPNARIHLKHMVHTHTHTHRCSTYMLKLTVTNTHALMAAADAANDNVKSAQLLRRLIWLPFCLPLSNALCHTAYSPPPPPPKKLETHICTPTHSNTQRCRPHNENTTICSRSLFFFLFFLADTPTHACTHLHAQRKPFSRFPPITAALACRRGRQEATFRKQKGAVALLRWRAHTRSRLQLQCKSQDERGAESLPHSSVHISQNPPSLLLLFPISRRAA